MLDNLDTHFSTIIAEDDNDAIRHAVRLGKALLNKYYSLTDGSRLYRIAMILHPSYRLQYFADAGWEQGWIDNARALVRQIFDLDYPAEDPPARSASQSETPSDTVKSKPNIMKPRRGTLKAASREDELDRYLSLEAIELPDDVSPVQWWRNCRTTFPRLSRMAIDYLTVPATSVEVERTFSRGRLLLTHTRNAMSAQTTRALMCLNSWSRAGLVRTKDVLQVVEGLDVVPESEEREDGDWWMEKGWDLIDHEL